MPVVKPPPVPWDAVVPLPPPPPTEAVLEVVPSFYESSGEAEQAANAAAMPAKDEPMAQRKLKKRFMASP
jgi:hypothetical protein